MEKDNNNTEKTENGERRHLSSAERQALYAERAKHRAGRVADKKKRKKLTIIISAVLAAVLLVSVIVVCAVLNKKVWTPNRIYREASELYDKEDYLSAYDLFLSLGDRNDAAQRAADCILMNAKKLSGKDDVLIGSSKTMPWFSLAEDTAAGITHENGYIKFDNSKYKGPTDIVIPDVFEGILVRGIYDKCFFYCDFVTSVQIPASTEYIGERAFFACTELKELILPDSVKKIGENVFASCIALEKIRLGKGIGEIPPRAFKDAVSLTEIVIPEGVSVIGVRAFNGCEKLTELSLPSTLETVSNYAFTGCSKLKKIAFAGTRDKLTAACKAEDADVILKCDDISFMD